ncbi:MAG: hypothetical protein DME65_10225 [Verrucomicrobia bacterium]|nr:MAG: hypothetical protein DME65_10225 [Verrucomicrobiota bacterium]
MHGRSSASSIASRIQASGNRAGRPRQGKATRRKLQTIAKALRNTGRVGSTPSLNLKPGTRLVREWRGRTHRVTVTEDGFEYADTSYSSLTKIANKITGGHWSGPRFFGLPAAGQHVRRRVSTCSRSMARLSSPSIPSGVMLAVAVRWH